MNIRDGNTAYRAPSGRVALDSKNSPTVTKRNASSGGSDSWDWQAKLGFLVPSGNSIFERDAKIALPASISAHVARMPLTRDDPEELAALHEAAPAASELLAHAGVDVVVFACTSGSLYHGLGFDKEISERITAITGTPASTTSTAVVEALGSLALRNIVLVSPYEPWLEGMTVEFLKGFGITVTATLGPGIPDGYETMTPDEIADHIRPDMLQEADGVFISCTDFRGMEAAAELRRRHGVPVVSSNEATLWAALRLIGLAGDTFPQNGYEDLGR